MGEHAVKPKKSLTESFLGGIERVCNKLPTPFILFVYLFLFAAVLGAVLSVANVQLLHPGTGEMVGSKNLFSLEGMNWFLDSMVKNFTGFAPLGLVLTMTLGIGMCEESGMLTSLIKSAMKGVPPVIVPYVIAFIGTVGNIASDTAMVVIPPLAALAYIGVGKHPIAGLICGYAGAQAGFSANLMIAGTDSLLQALTNTSIKAFLPDSTFQVEVVCNWYFMMASTFLCMIVIGFVCTHLVEKRLGEYTGDIDPTHNHDITALERKGLRNSGIAALLYIAVILLGMFGPGRVLMHPETKGLLSSPFLKGLIPILFFLFVSVGLAYGFTTGHFKKEKDISNAMTNQMRAMAGFVIFAFSAGQFIALFNWTQLGTLLAISGAGLLESLGFTGIPLCVSFIILCMVINLFVSSGSAKWAILAPIFVPMFMLLGYHPGFTQLLYRIGDSPTNCFTPMSPYIWMVLSVAQAKYDKNATLGQIAANLIPIALVLQVVWIIFVVIWMLTGFPIGPGTGTYLPAGIL